MGPIEQLEARRLFASFTAASVADLIADIKAANAAGGANTVTLAAGSTFSLMAVDNSTDGATGLPVIAAGDNLSIVGNGATIQRSTAKGVSAFRLFDVAAGASLALSGLTLSNGLSLTSGSAGGGAILSQGTLSLQSVTIRNCTAQAAGGFTSLGAGGGVYSTGTLTIANSTIQNNQALGSASASTLGGTGGPGAGGGIYIAGGSASVMNSSLSSNVARGGDGGNGGYVLIFSVSPGSGGPGAGGAIYVAAGIAEITGTTITHNTAKGGRAGTSSKGISHASDGTGQGGGIYIASAVPVSLDSFTVAHTAGNTASTSDNDIFGNFTIL